MKIPAITQQPVGEFALGNIRQPNYAALGEAIGEFVDVAGEATLEILQDADTELSTATAETAKELSELRAILEESNSVPTEQVPDDVVHEVGTTVLDLKGDRVEIGTPRIFTHTVAEDWWAKKSEEIVQHWAGTIGNREARAKFLQEVGQRYVAPGTFAIGKASIIKRRAHNQASAENAIRDIISSTGPVEQREEQVREIISRQAIMGADPVWVKNRLAEIGPRIDQLEVQNQIFAAKTVDEIDQIEEDMWSQETRMTPEQLRTMGAQMDTRRREFEFERSQRQTENADKAMFDFINPDIPFNEMNVADLVNNDDITHEDGWVLYNALQSGVTTRASDPIVLSRYRGAIQTIQYTGNQAKIRDRAKLLRLAITRSSAGLNPNGTITGLPNPITGEDSFKLNKDLDNAVRAALENDEYDNALKEVYTWANVAVDLEGQITTALGGNQHQIDAALAFKRGLDNYMDQFGADAKPSEYFNANKDAFNPNNFSDGVNARFIEEVPQADMFMIVDPIEGTYTFNQIDQENFILWLASHQATMGAAEFERISTLFKQFYRGQGLAPEGGRLMLEPDDPLYRQFEALLPQVQE